MTDDGHREQPLSPWVVCKFGGSSVARAPSWRRIEEITRGHLSRGHRVLLVCSAISGVTDHLEEVVAALNTGQAPSRSLAAVREACMRLARDLGLSPEPLLTETLSALEATVAACVRPVPPRSRAALLAYGELLSSRLGSAWLRRRGLDVALVDARTLLRAKPAPADGDETDAFLSACCGTSRSAEVEAHLDATGAPVALTQGFIARGPTGETVLLGRGGSDVSAAYLAAAIGATHLEIWTDVPGMFTANPRIVPEARLLRRLSYDEAATLGALGAKVLHPRTLEPARLAGLSVRIGWTAYPEIEGTEIDGTQSPRGPKAITSRRDLLLLVMRRPASWQPVGFMAQVAGCFQRRGLSMDLIASCPAEIRATIDLAAFPSARTVLPRLLAELGQVCQPRVVENVACVSLAGTHVGPELLTRALGLARLRGSEVHLVSHAADGSHVSLVVDEVHADRLVNDAHRALLAGPLDAAIFGPAWEPLREAAMGRPRAGVSVASDSGGTAAVPLAVSPSPLEPTSEKGSPCQANS